MEPLMITNMSPAEVEAWTAMARTGKLARALTAEGAQAYEDELAKAVKRTSPKAASAPARPRKSRAAPKPNPEAHAHRWRLEPPSGPIIPAVCDGCGESRTFPAVPASNYATVKAGNGPRPAAR